MPLDILNFVRKWQQSSLTERSGYQDHFRDLCDALGVPRPNEHDTDGSSYTFEKNVTKTGTDDKGFADVWKRGWFAWEYKSKGGDLKAAYKQVNQYHEALENPRCSSSATSTASKSTRNLKTCRRASTNSRSKTCSTPATRPPAPSLLLKSSATSSATSTSSALTAPPPASPKPPPPISCVSPNNSNSNAP